MENNTTAKELLLNIIDDVSDSSNTRELRKSLMEVMDKLDSETSTDKDIFSENNNVAYDLLKEFADKHDIDILDSSKTNELMDSIFEIMYALHKREKKQPKSIFEPFQDGTPVKFVPNDYMQEHQILVMFNPNVVKKEFNIEDFMTKMVEATGLINHTYPEMDRPLSDEEKSAIKIQNMGMYGVFGNNRPGFIGDLTPPVFKPIHLMDDTKLKKIQEEASKHLKDLQQKFKTHGVEGIAEEMKIGCMANTEAQRILEEYGATGVKAWPVAISRCQNSKDVDVSEEIKFNADWLEFDVFFKLIGTEIMLWPVDGEYFHCGQKFTMDELTGDLSKMVERYVVDVHTFEEWSQSDYLEKLQQLKAHSFQSMVGGHCYYQKHSYGIHKILEWCPKRAEFKLHIEGDLGGTFWTHPLRILSWSNIIADLEKEKESIKKTE